MRFSPTSSAGTRVFFLDQLDTLGPKGTPQTRASNLTGVNKNGKKTPISVMNIRYVTDTVQGHSSYSNFL